MATDTDTKADTDTHGVRIVAAPLLDDKRMAFALAEDRIGHYPAFRDFLLRSFALERIGLSAPGWVQVPSGNVYALVFIGRSGEPFPAGLEVSAVVDALEPLDEYQLDQDLWALLRWLVAGAGGEWRVEDLDATGRLYKLPAAGA